MTSYPNVPFTDGSIWSSDLAYLAFNTPVYDDNPTLLGHRQRILDTELSVQPGMIMDRLAQVTSALTCSVSSGLTLSYTAGVVQLPSGAMLTVPSGLIAVPDNSTNFVYVAADGSIQVGNTPSVSRVLMAQVVTVGGQVSQLTNYPHASLRKVQPVSNAIKVFGGSNTADMTCTNGQLLDRGLYYVRNLVVPAGISITVDKFVRIYCSGYVQIDGSITVNPMTTGAAPFLSGTGSTGIVIGGLSGGGIGGGSGSSAGGASYSYGAQPCGSGGGLGYGSGTSTTGLSFGGGGRGGGGFWLEAGGNINITGSIVARGEAGQAGVITGSGNISGAGGGSGGLIYLSSLNTVNVGTSATLDVSGGTGGNGVNSLVNTAADGGSGGGGGTIVLLSPSNNTTGATLNLAGGAKGTLQGSGTYNAGSTIGGGGGGGFGGTGGNQSAGIIGKFLSYNYIPLGA